MTGWQLGLGVLGHRLMGLHDKLKGWRNFPQPGLDRAQPWQGVKEGIHFHDRQVLGVFSQGERVRFFNQGLVLLPGGQANRNFHCKLPFCIKTGRLP